MGVKEGNSAQEKLANRASDARFERGVRREGMAEPVYKAPVHGIRISVKTTIHFFVQFCRILKSHLSYDIFCSIKSIQNVYFLNLLPPENFIDILILQFSKGDCDT